jgi:hypothetical protein
MFIVVLGGLSTILTCTTGFSATVVPFFFFTYGRLLTKFIFALDTPFSGSMTGFSIIFSFCSSTLIGTGSGIITFSFSGIIFTFGSSGTLSFAS